MDRIYLLNDISIIHRIKWYLTENRSAHAQGASEEWYLSIDERHQ